MTGDFFFFFKWWSREQGGWGLNAFVCHPVHTSSIVLHSLVVHVVDLLWRAEKLSPKYSESLKVSSRLVSFRFVTCFCLHTHKKPSHIHIRTTLGSHVSKHVWSPHKWYIPKGLNEKVHIKEKRNLFLLISMMESRFYTAAHEEGDKWFHSDLWIRDNGRQNIKEDQLASCERGAGITRTDRTRKGPNEAR